MFAAGIDLLSVAVFVLSSYLHLQCTSSFRYLMETSKSLNHLPLFLCENGSKVRRVQTIYVAIIPIFLLKRVVPIFPQGQQSQRNASARENHPTRERRDAAGGEIKGREVSHLSRGVIFTRACVSLALLSLRENGDYWSCMAIAIQKKKNDLII